MTNSAYSIRFRPFLKRTFRVLVPGFAPASVQARTRTQAQAPAPALFLVMVPFMLFSAACSSPDQLADRAHSSAVTESSANVTVDDFRRAEELMSWNLESRVLRSDVSPQWIDDDRFWYRTRTEDGFRFYRVDPDVRERSLAFDHERLAGALNEVMDKSVSAGDLPFTGFEYINGESAILFDADDATWECDLGSYECTESVRATRPDESVLSPDGRWAAFIRDHNLWVRDMEGGEEFALTTGGVYRHGFATNSQGWFRSERPVLHWSPDSRKIATYRLDERDVADMHLLRTEQYRPVLESWPYALPGDSAVPMHERVILDVESRKKIWLDVSPSHQRTSNCCGLERDGLWADIEWSSDAAQLAFVTTSRDYREVNLYIADTETGDVRHIYRETADTFFESNLTSRGVPNWRVLFDRNEFIWFTRRDEWGHLYLHNLDDASLVRRITGGDWNVLDVLHVDEDQGTVYFTAVGKESGRDPYLQHLYKTSFGQAGQWIEAGKNGMDASRADKSHNDKADNDKSDNDKADKDEAARVDGKTESLDSDTAGGIRRREGITGTYGTSSVRDTIEIIIMEELTAADEPVLLSPQDANHEIAVSPSGRFFIDEYSSFRQPSVTVLRSVDGSELMTLERADITPLEQTPWTLPEPFVVKARDGETDMYGLLYKPSHFDPDNSYPIVINIYPGPQIGSVGTRSFSPSRRGQTHALAELGFIVIQVDALGTPMRSKSFHTAWYGDMSDNGIEDQIAAVQQLAERYPWIDADRAGIYGHSGGGYATMSALLRFPGVFKAGVASAGNMDNRGYTYYWGEKYQGPRVVSDDHDTFASQAIWKKAGQLQDHLLLTYGTMDSNVHPNTTLLLIDELIRENKDFDLIVMPNRGHGFANERYHMRRTFDFFVRHLMDTGHPREYKMNE